MTFEEYADWLSEQSRQGDLVLIPRKLIFDMGDGRCAYAHRLMFHWSLAVSKIGDKTSIEDKWCYTESPTEIVSALIDWRRNEWKGEPSGWQRHPLTGRRRPDGNPNRERIEP